MFKLLGLAALSLAGLCVLGACFAPQGKRCREQFTYVNGYPLFI